MSTNKLKEIIKKNISNIRGWSTSRKIIVIESDDWGSIRMSSLRSFEILKNAGIPVQKDHFNVNDSLESNSDLEILFETLEKFKDKTSRHPVMTGVNVVANPDFEKIKSSKFNEYFYEPYTETLKRYPDHNRVYNLWKEGSEKRLLVPIFHGREHLNVQRWMKTLQSGNKSTLLAFEHGITGIPRKGIDGEFIPNLQAAFDIDTLDEILNLKDVLKTGLNLFADLYGYRSEYFVPTNGLFNNQLENDLKSLGVKYINSGKIQKEPLGYGKFQKNYRFIGQTNKLKQIYLTRNCFFEPSSNPNIDWINSCLREISIAFLWHKPATISTHRVNYIGFLNPKNRSNSIVQFEILMAKILKLWPDVEFLTSTELGYLINSEQYKL